MRHTLLSVHLRMLDNDCTAEYSAVLFFSLTEKSRPVIMNSKGGIWMKKLYLAGFDVFLPDAKEQGRRLKALCTRHGFEGLYPLDNEASTAREIYEGNLNLLRSADAVVANMNDFRGADPDSGTCFEVGYAAALKKPVVVYRKDGRTMREALGETDPNGYSVEDFGMPMNLMIGCASAIVIGTFEDALKELQKKLK